MTVAQPKRKCCNGERAAIAAMIADRARQQEAGLSSDDNGSAFHALAQLAKDLGYDWPIKAKNQQ